jgi:hypothetical protein
MDTEQLEGQDHTGLSLPFLLDQGFLDMSLGVSPRDDIGPYHRYSSLLTLTHASHSTPRHTLLCAFTDSRDLLVRIHNLIDDYRLSDNICNCIRLQRCWG